MSGRGDPRAQSGGGALGAGGGSDPPGRPRDHDDEDAIRAHATADPKASKRLLKVGQPVIDSVFAGAQASLAWLDRLASHVGMAG